MNHNNQLLLMSKENAVARLPSLDGLRGLAIIFVMIYHFTIINPDTWLEKAFVRITEMGMHGVDLFFVLSGFLITGILLDSKGHHHYFRNFYMRRILRIFPLYYSILLFSLVILPLLISYFPYLTEKRLRIEPIIKDWPWYVFYFSNFLIAKVDAFRHGILDVTWSLAIEEQFYVLWPILVFFLRRKHLKYLCICLVLGALISRIWMWLSGASWLQIYVLTPCRVDTLALGALIATVMRDTNYRASFIFKNAGKAFIIFTCLLVILLPSGFMYYQSPIMFLAGYLLIALYFSQLLIIIIYYPHSRLIGKIFRSRWLIFMGKYSYAIYLFHLPVRAVIRDLAFNKLDFVHGADLFLAQFLFYIVATVAVIPLALLSWHLLENPMLKLKALFPH